MKKYNDNKKSPERSPNSGHPPRRGPNAFFVGEKADDFSGTLKKGLKYLRPFMGRIILATIMCIAANIFGIISPKLLGDTTDLVIKGVTKGTGVDFSGIVQLGILLLMLYLLELLASVIEGWLLAGISMNVTYNLREAMSEKMNRLPLSYFDRETKGEIQSRFINDVETVSQTLSESMSQALSSIVTLMGVIIMMVSINPLLTLIVFLSMPLSIILIRVVVKLSQGHFSAQQALLGKANSHIEEIYSGHLIVKAFNGEEEAKEKFSEINGNLKEAGWKSQFLSSIMMPLSSFVSNITYVIICIVGGYMIIGRRITIGSVQAFIQYIRSFTRPLSVVANVANVLQSTAAAAERIFQFLEEDEDPSLLQAEKAASIKPEQLSNADREDAHGNEAFKGKITFEDVSFGYEEDLVIKNFNCEINPGDKIAIVGPTGAGKTTLVKLLMGFYPLKSGRILIDGKDIANMDRNTLRGNISMVLQDAWLFTGTIAENISYGKENASMEDIKKASYIAYADKFISALPHGYDTELSGEGSSISQGQKQLLTIARAVLEDAPILILDEATSSVDTRTELLIQIAMDRLAHGKTSLVIAHRLSTIKSADKILVIDNGDIVEQGNHKELMKKGGFYANLYNSQF